MKYIICIIILIACVCDKTRDKYSSHPQWRRVYKQFWPKMLWRKVHDRWHIVKNIGFLLPLGFLDYLVYREDWILALVMLPLSYVVWDRVVKAPEHWRR